MAAQLAQTSSPTAPPPVLKLWPYLRTAVSITSSLVSASATLFSRLSKPYLFLLLVPLLYLSAPVVVFVQTAYNVFLRLPFGITLYILEAIYPLYVFVGVACITGAILGLGSRRLATILVKFATQIQDGPQDTAADESSSSEGDMYSLKDEDDDEDRRGRSPRRRRVRMRDASASD
ncbi:hypothetical protein AX16_008505 [Volvariella volvacea WC 439]|nr:hypothetical protein AX16_008505 [Volvariella volvacea WC 439]